MTKIFEYQYTPSIVLREIYDNGSFYLEYDNSSNIKRLKLYSKESEVKPERNLYLGHTMEEVLSAGKDILGDELLKNGDPDYSELKKVMPEITKSAYCFLSAPSSWYGVIVDTDGKIYPQDSANFLDQAPMFSPTNVDERLGNVKPRQVLLDAEYPILTNVYTDGVDTLELLYFVESGDTGRVPKVFIREKRYKNESPSEFSVEYRIATDTDELGGQRRDTGKIRVDANIFLGALADTVSHWICFYNSGARIDIPEKEIERVGRGALAFASLTFTADHPHYGHKYYGGEVHDNFPPNYIWAIEAASVFGHGDWARRIFSHLINYATNENGIICYRLGAKMNWGSSAAEYGMILHLAYKYRKILGVSALSEKEKKKLFSYGDVILENCKICPEFENLLLVKMCAEADNNARINVYLNNNLWAIHGLRALAKLIGNSDGNKYADTADVIEQNINYLVDKHSVKGTQYGDIPPFRFGYPTVPYNLSNCDAFSVPVTDEERERYFSYNPNERREYDVTEQEISENTYANYRYYPEILSAMLLKENYSDGIFNMRGELGGNLVGMTRFRSWIDNWPVLNYAKYLLETERIEKYLLLLYAHTAHHGHPDLMCYYEQIKLWGEVSAHDCVPSLLTTPTMLAWLFAYERMNDGKLTLLRAVPEKWYGKPFSARKIGYSGGTLDIVSDGESITVEFSSPTQNDVELTIRSAVSLNLENIKDGVQYVERIEGNKIILKNGITYARLIVK